MKHSHFLFLMLFLVETGIAQSPDSIRSVNNKVAFSFGIGPGLSMTDNYDMMIGPNVMFCYLGNHHIAIALDFHAAISNQTKILGFPQFVVAWICEASLMSGYRMKLRKNSALQFQGGISFGRLAYNRERFPKSSSSNASWSENGVVEKIQFIGLPLKASYILIHKIVGLEIYVSYSLHPHFETAAGLNLLLGRLK